MTASEGASLASLSSKLTRAWTSVEGRHKEGAHKQMGGAQKLKGGAAPHYDALAKALHIHVTVRSFAQWYLYACKIPVVKIYVHVHCTLDILTVLHTS